MFWVSRVFFFLPLPVFPFISQRNISSKWMWGKNDKHTLPRHACSLGNNRLAVDSNMLWKLLSPKIMCLVVVVMMMMMAAATWSWDQCWLQNLSFPVCKVHRILTKAFKTNKAVQPLNQHYFKQVNENTVLYTTQAVSNHRVYSTLCQLHPNLRIENVWLL